MTMTQVRLQLASSGILLAAGLAASAVIAQTSAPAPLATPSAPHPWIQGAPFPEPSEEVLGATAGGKLYVFAGLAPGWKPKAMTFEYDPASNQWTKKRPMRLPSHHVAFAGLNNKIYAFGGFSYPSAGAPGVGDKIYVIGGRVGAAFISSASNNVDLVEMYDPATDLWTPRARMPTARSAIGGGVYNGNILVAGGEGQDQRFLAAFKAVEAYDPARNQWQALPSMPHPRHGLAVGAIGNRLYTVSGDGQSAGNGIEHSAVAYNEILQVDLVLK